MSKFSDFIQKLDLKSIITINIFLAVLVLIPLSVYLSQRQTRLTGRAYQPLPTITLLSPTPTPAPPPITPAGPSEIFKVYPFYGKAGDSVVIYGKNFGNQKGLLLFNNLPAEEISLWEDNKIVALVAKGAASGKIRVNSAVSPFNFTVFDETTACQVLWAKEANRKIFGLSNCPLVNKIKLIFSGKPSLTTVNLAKEALKTTQTVLNDESLEILEINLPGGSLPEKLISTEDSAKIVSLELYRDNSLISFYIDPLSLIN